jgi:hypothetical protein
VERDTRDRPGVVDAGRFPVVAPDPAEHSRAADPGEHVAVRGERQVRGAAARTIELLHGRTLRTGREEAEEEPHEQRRRTQIKTEAVFSSTRSSVFNRVFFCV